MNKQENDDVMALRNACVLLRQDFLLLVTDAFYNGMITSTKWKKGMALSEQAIEAIKKVEAYIT